MSFYIFLPTHAGVLNLKSLSQKFKVSTLKSCSVFFSLPHNNKSFCSWLGNWKDPGDFDPGGRWRREGLNRDHVYKGRQVANSWGAGSSRDPTGLSLFESRSLSPWKILRARKQRVCPLQIRDQQPRQMPKRGEGRHIVFHEILPIGRLTNYIHSR